MAIELIAAGLDPESLTGALAAAAASTARIILSSACHSIEARSHSVASVVMPVCARCTGIYLGLALGALVPRVRARSSTMLALLGIALFVLALDVATEAVQLRPANATLRTVTGISVGTCLALLGNSRRVRHQTTARPAGYLQRARNRTRSQTLR